MEQIPSTLSDNQYRRALRSLRAAKNGLGFLLVMAILVNLGAMAAVRFWPAFTSSPSLRAALARPAPAEAAPTTAPGVTPAPPAATEPAVTPVALGEMGEPPATAPAIPPLARLKAQPATATVPDPNVERAEKLYLGLGIALPVAMSLGLVCVVMLVVVLNLSLWVVMIGRVGDTGHMVSALIWSLVLAVVVMPWHLAFGHAIVPGVLYMRSELIDATSAVIWGAQPDWRDLLFYYARFAAYPLVALLLWLQVQLKAGAGMRQAGITYEE